MSKLTITWKVLIGFLLMVAVLSAALVFTYRSLDAVKDSVRVIGEPNRKVDSWRSVVRLMQDANSAVNRWNITKSSRDLERVDSCRVAILNGIQFLYRLNSDNTLAKPLVDSLAGLNELWFRNLGQRIATADTTGKDHFVINTIIHEMELHEQAVQEKADTAGNNSYKAEKSSFWKEVLHGFRKKHPDETAMTTDSIPAAKKSKDKIVQTSVIRKAIQKGKLTEESKELAELREQLDLQQENFLLTARIRSNSDRYQKIMAGETERLLRNATGASATSARNVSAGIIGAALVLISFFVFIISRDVGRERKLKRELVNARKNAESLARAKEQFVANMSHEIRTPLNIISGFSGQLLKSSLSSTQRVQAEGIARSSSHLIAVVNEILDYSKSESGKLELESIAFSACDLEKDIAAAFEPAALEKELHLKIETAPDLPHVLIGDPLRIRQILYNLVSNAIKFTEKGGVHVRLSKKADRLVISVSDSGIGIPADKKETIFDAFTQAETSTTRRFGGTGLGLTITRLITEKMNGTIRVDSTPGAGSTFTVDLPLVAGSESDLPATAPAIPDGDFLSGITILICDDEPMNRIVASQILAPAGAALLEASNGKEALELISTRKTDIVLLDLQMPGMDGHETALEIRRIYGKNAPAIVAVSGLSAEKEKERCFAEGMKAYLVKPFHEADLLGVIRSVC